MTGSLQIKNGKYHAVISYRDKDGVWQRKWQATGYTVKGNKKRAEQKLNEFIIDFKKSLSEPPKNLFTEYLEKWLKIKKPQIEGITYELYYHIVNTHIAPYFKPLKLHTSEITFNILQNYINEKAVSGKINRGKQSKDSKNNSGLSWETLNKHKMILGQVFDMAILDGIITVTPVKHIKIPKKQEKKIAFYSVEEANALLDVLNDNMMKPIVLIALYYGLRRSEILGLKWDAIDFDKGQMSIHHTAVKSLMGKKGKTYYKDSTKNKTSCTTFPLIDEVKNVLLKVKCFQENNRQFFGNEYILSDYVFTWQDGRLIQPDYVSKKFKKLLKKHNLPDINFHNLRHTTASILVKKGFDIKSIQMWLRHANVKTTLNIYAHVSEDSKTAIAKDISDIFAK